MELLFKVLAGDIDTHVLMTLACFGTLAIGAAMEASFFIDFPAIANQKTSPSISDSRLSLLMQQ